MEHCSNMFGRFLRDTLGTEYIKAAWQQWKLKRRLWSTKYPMAASGPFCEKCGCRWFRASQQRRSLWSHQGDWGLGTPLGWTLSAAPDDWATSLPNLIICLGHYWPPYAVLVGFIVFESHQQILHCWFSFFLPVAYLHLFSAKRRHIFWVHIWRKGSKGSTPLRPDIGLMIVKPHGIHQSP